MSACPLAALWRWLRRHPGPDPDLLKVVEDFRRERVDSLEAELARRRGERSLMHALQRELDDLRHYRAEAERRMMAHGIDLPKDD